MTTKTLFSADEFKHILSNYDLGEYRQHQPFEQGTDQTNIMLRTIQGKFAFRYYEKRTQDYVCFEIDLLQHLTKHSYLCPKPLPDKSGGQLGTHRGKPFAIFEFLPGEHNDAGKNGKEVAEAVGQLHVITSHYTPRYAEAREHYDQQSCWENATLNAAKIQPAAERQARLRWLRARLDELQPLATLPNGIVHGDPNPSNFLYQNGALSAVLDFDQASVTFLLYDVAALLFWWAWPKDGSLDFVRARQLLAAYERRRRLTDHEKTRLFDMLKMLNLVSVGWFIYEDRAFVCDKRNVGFLNGIGRDEFSARLFGEQPS